MSNEVQFDEPTYGNQMPIRQRDSLPTRLVLKMGVKREQVPIVLIGVAVAATLVMLFVGFGGNADKDQLIDETGLTPEENILLEQ